MTARSGAASLVELVLVTLLFAVVLTALAGFAAQQGRLAAAQRDLTRLEEATRTMAVVLGAELRFLTVEDVTTDSRDSLRLRAFRGGGAVCGAEGDTVWAAYAGVRLPEPAKDSVVLLGAGWSEVAALAGTEVSGRCAGAMRMRLDRRPATPPVYVLLFESGSYHLSGGALRYRRGAGGRQPLTEAILRDMAFTPKPGGVGLDMGFQADSLPRLAAGRRTLSASYLNARPTP